MAPINTVTVTGASGFIGAHIVRECLERGFTVNACVRNKDDSKNSFLVKMAQDIGKGKVVLFSADLTAQGSYDAAVSNADAVIHAAAQVDPGVIKDPMKDMVEPSTKGTLNILSSVNKHPNVKHYVHTSSMAAVGVPHGAPATEDTWSNATIETSPYNFAKLSAEKLVWEETKGKPYTVSCINPSMVFGPCLAKPHCKASPFVFRQALLGNKQPNSPYSVVDVRQVAYAHVEAMLRPDANGKRFILDDDEPFFAVNDIIKKCREMFPAYEFSDAPGPKLWNDKFIDPVHFTRSGTNNTRSKQVLGVKYTSADQCLRDSVESMIKNQFVVTRPRAKL